MERMKLKRLKRERRAKRVRAKIKGNSEVPRLSVFRSNRHIYAQLIDDCQHKTILSLSDFKIEKFKDLPQSQNLKGKKEKAFEVGYLIAKKALQKKIKKVIFDRGPYKYHGRVKALAEGIKKGGLEF